MAKPNYFSFSEIVRISKKDGSDVYGICLLDVEPSNEYFEIVHCHLVKEKT